MGSKLLGGHEESKEMRGLINRLAYQQAAYLLPFFIHRQLVKELMKIKKAQKEDRNH
jgi:hypothetical protein